MAIFRRGRCNWVYHIMSFHSVLWLHVRSFKTDKTSSAAVAEAARCLVSLSPYFAKSLKVIPNDTLEYTACVSPY